MAGSVITCPECDKKFKGKGDLQGKKVRCPFCKEAFTVPEEEQDEPVVAVAEAKAEPPRAPSIDDDNDINPYGVKNQDLAVRCPNCANEMADENATICLFCGYNTLTRTWGRTVKVLAHTPGQIVMHLLPGILMFLLIVMLIGGMLYFCVVVPSQVAGGWLFFLDHESLRMWSTIFGMGVVWGCGMYCYKRFIIEPLPPEVEKD